MDWKALKPLFIIGAILAFMVVAVQSGIEGLKNKPEVISTEQFRQFCADNGIPQNKCKVKKLYVVVPKSSR